MLKSIGIFVGGDLISAPRVSEAIAGGQAQISGNFDLESANTLARDLNTGAIPAPIELTGQYTISATLGAEALEQSMKAGMIGLVILAVYMIAYYRVPGVLATVALAVYSVLMIFFVKIALPTQAALLPAWDSSVTSCTSSSKEKILEVKRWLASCWLVSSSSSSPLYSQVQSL